MKPSKQPNTSLCLLVALLIVALLAYLLYRLFAMVRPAEGRVITGKIEGEARHYGIGDGYTWRTTRSGEVFNSYGMTCASNIYPLGTRPRVYYGEVWVDC